MENKQIALSDVERNKELFEYEMTEVILQLKGEFAKVSGKDMKLDDAQLSAPSIQTEAKIPSVSIDTIALDLQEADTIDSDKLALPKITITKTSIDCPAVPTVKIVPIGEIKVDKTQLDCLAANADVTANLEKVKIVLPSVEAVNSKITIPQINADTVIEAQSTPHFDGLLIPKKIEYTPHDVAIQQIAVDVPNTELTVNDNLVSVNVDVSVNVPVVPTVAVYNNVSVDVQKASKMGVDPVIPNQTQYTATEVEIKMPGVDVANTSVKINLDAEKVVLQDIKVNVPTIKNIDIATIDSITTMSSAIKLPQVQECHVSIPEQIITSKISLSDDVSVPSVRVRSGTNTVIKIDKTNVNYEYTTVHSVPLQNVAIQSISDISIPEMPDFSDAIREILESAV
ncbi:MAG: hypothetical protein NC177_13740 [Ruminococcus flavefaciens]|nr:hypothetical protein [Ruminococcus flavefaciens]